MSQSLPTSSRFSRRSPRCRRPRGTPWWARRLPPSSSGAWLEALEGAAAWPEARAGSPATSPSGAATGSLPPHPPTCKSDSNGEFVFDFLLGHARPNAPACRYYPKLVIAAPLTPATGRRFLVAPGEDPDARLRELARGALELARARSGCPAFTSSSPPRRRPLALEPLGFAVRQGVQYHFLNEGYRTPDDVLQRFNSKRRNQLKRERRAPSEQGLTVRVLRGDALAEADPRETFRLYASTVDKFAWGRRYLNPRFFAQVLERFRHRVELVEALAGDRVVAGAFNLASDRVLYGRYWGCFEEHPFLHFNVCLYAGMDEVVRRGLVRFEPGAGGEHKLARGFTPSLTYSAHLSSTVGWTGRCGASSPTSGPPSRPDCRRGGRRQGSRRG